MRSWTSSTRRRRQVVALFACAATALVVAGCGEKDFANDPRPPSPIDLTALISDKAVIISPQPSGAGPVTITISNQSKDPAKLTLEKSNGEKISSPEILPDGGTGKLSADLAQGEYTASTGDEGTAKTAKIKVGPERESAQNQLLLP
jgi:hypothetical protein